MAKKTPKPKPEPVPAVKAGDVASAKRRARAQKGGKVGGKKAREKRVHPGRFAATRDLERHKVVTLRDKGRTLPSISAALGMSVGKVHTLLHEALAHVRKLDDAVTERIRGEQINLMDRGQMLVVSRLFDEGLTVVDSKPDGSKMELSEFEKLNKLSLTLIKYGERIAKLAGVDAPERVEGTQAPMYNAEILGRMLAEKLRQQHGGG